MDQFTEPQQDMFEEKLVPKKPLYKRWWVYAYGVLFISSLVILVALADTTSVFLDAFSFDTTQEVVSGAARQDDFTTLPGLGLAEEVDYTYAREVLGSLNAPTIGLDNAPVTIVEFADFRCPYCRESFPIIKQLLAEYPQDITFVYADFPIAVLHPLAVDAAVAARCAAEQDAFWAYHDVLFANQDAIEDTAFFVTLAGTIRLDTAQFKSCVDADRYRQDVLDMLRIGTELGVTGTPTFFVNGHRLPGSLPLDAWKQVIMVAKLDTTEE